MPAIAEPITTLHRTAGPDWQAVRRQFPLRRDLLHFAQFFMVSHPQPVREAIERHRRAIDESPFLTVEHGMFGEPSENLSQRVHQAAARFLGGEPGEVALVPNTTTGLALVYHGLPLGPGDEVLTTAHDHFTHHEAIRLATARAGATWRRIALFDDSSRPSLPVMVERVRRALRPRTRVLGLTWVHSNSGLRLPIRPFADLLAEVNAARPPGERVRLVVDGTHGFGAFAQTMPEMGCDLFVASAHKWLCGPRGTGVIWAPEAVWREMQPVVPTYSTWDLWQAWAQGAPPPPTRAAYVTPGGFLAYEHQWALVEAFAFQESIGRRAIERRILDLNGLLVAGLDRLPGVRVHTPQARAWQSGIVSFDVVGVEPGQVVRDLLARGIVASTSPYAVPSVRLSAGIANDEEEVDRVLAALRRLVAAAPAR